MSHGGDGHQGFAKRGRGRGQPKGKNIISIITNEPKSIFSMQKNYQPSRAEGLDKEVDHHTKDRLKEELLKQNFDHETRYSKFELLEMFSSVNFDKAKKIMKNYENMDIVVDQSQHPVLLEEVENELTLDDLRPRKGAGGPRKRSKF
jgi:hypothetical protein